MSIKISVIIPLYNKEALVEKCICSVLKQSFMPDEIILVDDGSTDNSVNIVIGILRDNNVQVDVKLIEQSNYGVSTARNVGIKKAKNELVALLDADDEWEPCFLEEMLALIYEFPDASMYSSFHFVRDGDGNYFKPQSVLPHDFKGYVEDYFLISKKMPIVNSSKVILRKEDFLTVGGFPEGAVLTEDLFLWFKMALDFKVAFLNKALVVVNQVPDSSRRARNNKVPFIIQYYSERTDEFDSFTVVQKEYLFSVYLKQLLGALKEGAYVGSFNQYRVGFLLFKAKVFYSLALFFIPPFVYKFLKVLNRKLLSFKS